MSEDKPDNPTREWLEKHAEEGPSVSARNPEVYIPSGYDQYDIAELEQLIARQPFITLTKYRAQRMIECIRECAMEAEIGHELGGLRVTLLQRYGLTDGSDPAFGPVKYPKPDRGDKVPF